MTEKEGYESTAEPTEHAVDSGVVIVDHLKRNPDTITLEGMVTNSPLVLPRVAHRGVTGGCSPPRSMWAARSSRPAC